MQIHKSTLRILMMVLCSTTGTLLMGYMMGIYNTVSDNIEILIPGVNKDLVTSIVPLGAMFGCLICNLLQKSPRRLLFIIADIITIGGLMLTIVQKNWTLILGRFIVGLMIGINSTIIPVYINEISPIQISGLMGSCFQTMCNVGFLIVFALGINVPSKENFQKNQNKWWMFMFLFPIITCILRITSFLLIFKKDTPAYYVIQKNKDEAEEALEEIYNSEYVENQYIICQQVNNSNKNVTYSELFTAKYASRLFIGLSLPIIQQLSGINAILFYSTDIIKNNKNSTLQDSEKQKLAQIITAIIGFLLTLSAILGGKFIDRFGRKIILIIGEVICIVCLVFLAVSEIQKWNQYVSIAFILIYVFGFGMSLGPIVWVYIPEILPSCACTISTLINWLFVFIISYSFNPLVGQIQIQGCFLLFAGFCLAGLIFIIIFVKETKGKSTDEIEQLFQMERIVHEEMDSYRHLLNNNAQQ